MKGTVILAPVSPPITVIVVVNPEFDPNTDVVPIDVKFKLVPLTVTVNGVNCTPDTSVAEVVLAPPAPVKLCTNLPSEILNM